jgi:protein TonB
MMDKPDVAPDVNMVRLENPALTQRVGVQGPTQPRVDPYSRYGLLNGLDNDSNGPGSGGGIGTGRGGGVGSGNGSGLGSGSGGGAGSGSGGGIGDGDGRGGPPGPPPAVIRESTPVKIISKPKAPYTDQARQNNVQGSVTLKITFLANGQVGGVTAVTRLPYGLTENAIAAAKQIRFEPKKVNGVPVTTTMTFQYGFNIY